MEYQLSGIAIVICIAGGVLVFILLTIMAKREIMRVTFKPLRGIDAPPTWHMAPKALRQEIERRLNRVPDIQMEPRLLRGDSAPANCYYRMKAVDDVKVLASEIGAIGVTVSTHPGDHLRTLLIGLTSGPLKGADTRKIHEFCDYYEHARYLPDPFQKEEYKLYNELLRFLTSSVRRSKSRGLEHSTGISPSHTQRSDHRSGGSGSQDSAIEQEAPRQRAE